MRDWHEEVNLRQCMSRSLYQRFALVRITTGLRHWSCGRPLELNVQVDNNTNFFSCVKSAPSTSRTPIHTFITWIFRRMSTPTSRYWRPAAKARMSIARCNFGITSVLASQKAVLLPSSMAQYSLRSCTQTSNMFVRLLLASKSTVDPNQDLVLLSLKYGLIWRLLQVRALTLTPIVLPGGTKKENVSLRISRGKPITLAGSVREPVFAPATCAVGVELIPLIAYWWLRPSLQRPLRCAVK